MNVLLQGTSDFSDLTQYKYVKQTVIPKHFNVSTTLTSFLTNIRRISYPSLVEVKKKAHKLYLALIMTM